MRTFLQMISEEAFLNRNLCSKVVMAHFEREWVILVTAPSSFEGFLCAYLANNPKHFTAHAYYILKSMSLLVDPVLR